LGKGGRRPGAGRKPKSLLEHQLAGTKPRGRLLRPAAFAPVPADPIDPPAELSPEELAIWQQLGPSATSVGTLRPETAYAFTRLVRHAALERKYDSSVRDCGSAGHRQLMKILIGELLAFGLLPSGATAAPRPQLSEPARAERDRIELKYFHADEDGGTS
jgi:hypothetical protein